jgi:hypothetical protein
MGYIFLIFLSYWYVPNQFHTALSSCSIGSIKTRYHEKFLVLEENFHHRLDKWRSGFQTCFGTLQPVKMPIMEQRVLRPSRHKRNRSMNCEQCRYYSECSRLDRKEAQEASRMCWRYMDNEHLKEGVLSSLYWT